jgi:hypothetical protein
MYEHFCELMLELPGIHGVTLVPSWFLPTQLIVFCDSFSQNITFLISNQVFITLIPSSSIQDLFLQQLPC